MIHKIVFPFHKTIRSFVQSHIQLFRIFIFIFTGLILFLFYPNQSSFRYDYRVNKPWLHPDLIAPFDFSINKSDRQMKEERLQVKQSIIPYYFYDSLVTAQKREEFNVAIDDCVKNGTPLKITNNERSLMTNLLDTLFEKGIIHNQNTIAEFDKSLQIQLIRDNKVERFNRDDFFNIISADLFIKQKLIDYKFENIEKSKSFLESFLVHNIVYDPQTTQKDLQLGYENLSATFGLVQKGERIVSKGELVSQEKFQIISSLEVQYKEESSISGFLFNFGALILIVIALFLLYFYIYLFDKKVYFRLKRLALLSTVFLSMVFSSFLLFTYAPDYIYAFPFCLFAISNKVFFSSRVSILSYLIGILLIGTVVTNGFEFVLIQSFVGIAAILSLKSLYRRAQFVLTTAIIFVLYLTVFLLRTMMLDNGFDFLNTQQMWMFTISAGLTLFAYPYLFILEKSFKLVTDFTLLELSNTNLPLLRELATKAPGTFLHSILVANIAEEVTHKINGNILLVRTGALYHDIGKLSNPSFFIENQHGVNPHNELPADESAAIITNHVTEGLVLARKYKLPDEIMGFIRTHHGTRKTAFFYNKFVINNPHVDVQDQFFSYMGPTPRTKEEAVLMLADIFEAATRSMKEPSKENISAFVENMVDKLIENHQFDDANITFKDLKIIKETFKTQLINIYHKRIEYPKTV